MQSVAQALAQAKGRPSGFDYMRLALATGVIVQHTVNVSYGSVAVNALFHSPLRPIFGLILPMFFSLSGFLVAGSLERNKSLISFLGLRALRILPALGFEIVLSAFVLGVIFTNCGLYQYFTEVEFRAYFWNLIGYIHYHLPGVFANNPDRGIVNAQLWTIPAELKCYVALAALGFFGIIGRRSLTVWIVVAAQLLLAILAIHYRADDTSGVTRSILVGCFLVGVCAFRARDAIPLAGPVAILAGAAVAVLLSVPHGDWFLPIPVAYLTIYLGVLNPSKRNPLMSGDYSYGVYLYGYPVQQAVATQSWTHECWINFGLSYPIIFALAVVSWRLVEKPAMKLKSVIYLVEERGLRSTLIKWHSRHVFAMAAPSDNAMELSRSAQTPIKTPG